MKSKIYLLMILCLAVAGAVIAGGCLSADEKSPDLNDVGMSSFTSEKEMLKYFENRSVSGSRFLSSYGGSGSNDMAVDAPAGVPAPEAPATMEASDNSKAPDYSKTNVQIAGVDEADIIKTDGKIIYYTPNLHYPTNITEHTDSKYPYYTYDTYQITLVINAMPAATASIISQIKETGGNLYLADDLLIVIKTGMDNQIVAYDISDPVHPKVMWEQAYEGYYTDSRLIGDKLYFISGDYGFGLLPITYMGKELVYTDFYYPGGPDIIRPAADNTYYVTKMDVKTGSVEDTKVFISSYRSIFFVSADNLYLTNHYYPDTQLMFLNFVESNGSDYLLAETMQYIKKVMGYDLSSNIKYMAVSEAINNYTSGLTGDENTAFSDSFYEDYNAYSSALIIEAEKTTITKINLETFNVVSGVVPGRINDKFSMDEKDGYLRVISSVGDDYRTDESTLRSMVSVLSSEMETVGTLDNVAAGEYVQTTRYVGNTLYLMTYAENDPFLLIDLSNPESPSVLGEMRLQGTYNYIYPISDTLLVGFGYTGDWRDMRTKLSLYDVSNPQNPIELDVFYFNNDEYVSVYDYRGFTWNAAKNLMIVSGSNTAYVFEIKENQITLMKEDMHEGGYITRSAYVGNYLYVFSDAEIHVYDMANWQRVQVISIEQPVYPEYGTIYPIHDEPVYAAQA